MNDWDDAPCLRHYYVDNPRNVPDYDFNHDNALYELDNHQWRINQAEQRLRDFLAQLDSLGFELEDDDITYRDARHVRELRAKLEYGPWPQLQRNKLVDLLDGQLTATKNHLIEAIGADMLRSRAHGTS